MQILHNDVLNQSVSVRSALSTFKKVLQGVIILVGIYSWYNVALFVEKHNFTVTEVKSPVKVQKVITTVTVPEFIEVPKIVEKVIIKEVKVPAPVEQKTQLKMDYSLTQPKKEDKNVDIALPPPSITPPVVQVAPAPAPPVNVDLAVALFIDKTGGECNYKLETDASRKLGFKHDSECPKTIVVNTRTGVWRVM